MKKEKAIALLENAIISLKSGDLKDAERLALAAAKEIKK